MTSALGAVLFIHVMRLTQHFFFDVLHPATIPFLGVTAIVLIPTLGGLLVAPITTYFAPETKGHGVPELMLAIRTKKGRLRPRAALMKLLASAITLTSGGSAGREGPIVLIGGGIGSTFSRIFNLTPGRTRRIIACGCAAAIAVVFNAPVAGSIFAIEIIIGDFAVRSFASVILSAVAGSVVGWYFLGSSPSFAIPAYGVVNPTEFGLFLALGVLAAGVALAFTYLLYKTDDLFEHGIRIPPILKPALGGLLVGIIAIWTPQVMGVGYDYINQVLTNDYAVWLLLMLIVLKMLATSFTLGSGASGGIMSPSLFMGAMLGTGFGTIAQRYLGTSIAHPGAYGLVGMAAVFGAAAQAPFTSIMLIFEMTRDYNLIVPVMFGVVIATVIYNHFRKTTIYTRKLIKRGVHYRFAHEVNVLEEIQVGEIMNKVVDSISEDTPYDKAYHAVFSSHHNGFPVVDREGLLVGIITEGDFGRHIITDTKRGHEVKLKEIMCTHVKSVYPDMSVWEVLKMFDTLKLGRFPVVSRDNPRKIIGIVTRSDIVHAYPEALKRHETEYEI
ncbi:chloride channel protein [bacterium]|nr:chloride channel protein [bacterium]